MLHQEITLQSRNNVFKKNHARLQCKIPIKFKGFILISLIQKQRKKQIKHLKSAFFSWYVNRNPQLHKQVLFKMLTKKVSPMAFFYRMKNYAEKSSTLSKKYQNLTSQKKSQPKINKNLNISNKSLNPIPILKKQNEKSSKNIQEKKCVFAQQVQQVIKKNISSQSQSCQSSYSEKLSQNSNKKLSTNKQLISLKVINSDQKFQSNNQKNHNRIDYFSKKTKEKYKENHLTQYFQSLKNIFSIKLDKNDKQRQIQKNDYKKKQIRTQGQQFVQQLDTSQISSFSGSKKSISFCPSFSSSFKNINNIKQLNAKCQSKKLIQKGFKLGTKVGLALIKSIISSIMVKQKLFFFTKLQNFINNSSQYQKFNKKISHVHSLYSKQSISSSFSLLNQNQYDQRMNLIKRNLQLLELQQQKQKEIFILCQELQVHHEELLQIQEQFNRIQMNLKYNFFVVLDRIFKNVKKQAFVQIQMHNQKMSVFSTLNQLLQDSDPFDQFSKNLNKNIQQSDSSMDQVNRQTLTQQHKNDITSIKVGLKVSQSYQNISSSAQTTSKKQIQKIHPQNLKRPSINIMGTERQLHKVYTLSSMNSLKSSLTLNFSQKEHQYSSKLLFQESIKQLNQIQEMNNESELFNNNSKISEQ